MVDQMRRPVHLETAIRNLIASDVDLIIEIGYNNTIKNFVKRIDRAQKVMTISDYDSFIKVLGDIKNAD